MRFARIDDTSLTLASTTLGSPGYMAPERYTGAATDHRVDLFSCGVLLYELLTGHKPFEGDAPTAVILKILKDDPTPICQRPAFIDATC